MRRVEDQLNDLRKNIQSELRSAANRAADDRKEIQRLKVENAALKTASKTEDAVAESMSALISPQNVQQRNEEELKQETIDETPKNEARGSDVNGKSVEPAPTVMRTHSNENGHSAQSTTPPQEPVLEISMEVDPVNDEQAFEHRPVRAWRYDMERQEWRGRGQGNLKVKVYWNKGEHCFKLVIMDDKNHEIRSLQWIERMTGLNKDEVQWFGADYTMNQQNPMIGKWKLNFMENEDAAARFMYIFCDHFEQAQNTDTDDAKSGNDEHSISKHTLELISYPGLYRLCKGDELLIVPCHYTKLWTRGPEDGAINWKFRSNEGTVSFYKDMRTDCVLIKSRDNTTNKVIMNHTVYPKDAASFNRFSSKKCQWKALDVVSNERGYLLKEQWWLMEFESEKITTHFAGHFRAAMEFLTIIHLDSPAESATFIEPRVNAQNVNDDFLLIFRCDGVKAWGCDQEQYDGDYPLFGKRRIMLYLDTQTMARKVVFVDEEHIEVRLLHLISAEDTNHDSQPILGFFRGEPQVLWKVADYSHDRENPNELHCFLQFPNGFDALRFVDFMRYRNIDDNAPNEDAIGKRIMLSTTGESTTTSQQKDVLPHIVDGTDVESDYFQNHNAESTRSFQMPD